MRVRQLPPFALSFFASALVASALVSAGTARGSTTRSQPASACNFVHGYEGGGFMGNGQYVNNTYNNARLLCPVASDATYSPLYSTGTTVTMFGWVNAGQTPTWSFYACRDYWAGGGGACGAPTQVNGVPNASTFASSVADTSAWAAGSAWDGYYVYAAAQPMDGQGSSNALWSYVVTTY
jgi:hypothetical protein